MPTIGNWFSDGEGQPDAIADIISYKSVSITLNRNGTPLSAQTMRLETMSGQRQMQGPGGIIYVIDGMVLGYKGHATITDTDIEVGDRFSDSGQAFEVIAIAPGHTDNVTAYLKLRS
jgi:hypothetical protein